MTFTFIRDQKVEEFFKHCNEAIVEHWLEIAANKEKILLNPDEDRYKKLEEAGILKSIVVYDGDELVGYSVLLVQPHLHYKDDLFAFVDLIFVKNAYRSSKVGLMLINETEKYAKELGVSMLTYHTKPTHATIEKILYRKGYSHYENIIGICLKEKGYGV